MNKWGYVAAGIPSPEDDNGHVWKTTENGYVDDFAFEIGDHNGPVCAVCGYFYCRHCHPKGAPKACPGETE